MSSSSFLTKMRKAQLEELSSDVGLITTGKRKAELEELLEAHLLAHPNLATDARFSPFYKRSRGSTDAGSPVKKERGTSTALSDTKDAIKTTARRTTKAVEDLVNSVDESDVDEVVERAKAVVARTPGRVYQLASQVPLPPSPAVVADAIERRSVVIRNKFSEVAHNTGVSESLQTTREVLSSVITIESFILLFEGFNLRQEVLPNRHAFTFPSLPLLKSDPHPVNLPDFFLLLTGGFWSPTILWSFTSILVPLVAAYFFNLTTHSSRSKGHQYQFDPLTFNVVKALLAYVVYCEDYTFGGLVDLESVARIRAATAGGWQGIVGGAAIGVLYTFYEAVVRK